MVIFIFFISYGTKIIPQTKKNIFFLEFEYSFIFILWTLNLFTSLILREIYFESGFFIKGFIFEPELMELLLYSILYLDTYSKITKLIKNSK